MGDDSRDGTDAPDDPDTAGTPDSSDKSDVADAPDTAENTGKSDDSDTAAGTSARGRDVVVPDRLYKSVTVFTTLFAVVAVVLGFVSLDVATNSGRAAASEVSVPLAVLGVALIATGGLVYAFASRFRARGMTTDKDSDDEPRDNG